MTKSEWMSELKKHIRRLPDDEIRRVVEYYDELFADKIEQGGRENEIISQFGNPVDVSDKILSEYDGELRDADSLSDPQTDTARSDEGIRSAHTAPQDTTGGTVPPQSTPVSPVLPNAASAPKAQRNLHGGRLAFVLVLHVLTCGVTVILAAALWIVVAALALSGSAMFLGGAASAIMSLFTLAQSVGAGVAQIGVGVALSGVGLLLGVGMVFAVINLIKLTKKFIVWLVNWVSPKEVPHA